MVFGGDATSATLELGALPIDQLRSMEVLHPGTSMPTTLTPTPQGDRMVLNVPLVNGCAMVRLLADKSSAAALGNWIWSNLPRAWMVLASVKWNALLRIWRSALIWRIARNWKPCRAKGVNHVAVARAVRTHRPH